MLSFTLFSHSILNINPINIFKNPPNFRKTKDLIPNRYEVYIYRSYKVIISFIDNDNFIRLNKINGAL